MYIYVYLCVDMYEYMYVWLVAMTMSFSLFDHVWCDWISLCLCLSLWLRLCVSGGVSRVYVYARAY